MHRHTARPRTSRLQRAVLALLTTCSLLGVTTLTGAESASAASSCNSPVSGKMSYSIFRKGVGAFACTGVYSVASKVDFYTQQNGSSPYELRTTTGWLGQGTIGAWRNWSNRTVWVSVVECHTMYVRSWVRWKYPRATEYTYRTTIRTWTSC